MNSNAIKQKVQRIHELTDHPGALKVTDLLAKVCEEVYTVLDMPSDIAAAGKLIKISKDCAEFVNACERGRRGESIGDSKHIHASKFPSTNLYPKTQSDQNLHQK